MFGWLTHVFAPARPACRHTGSICRCLVRMPGEVLLAHLSLLGGVLYLPSRQALGEPSWGAPGWLVAGRELSPLLQTRQLMAFSMIGADGPREWIDCIDDLGRTCARLHLLPDTDYLAWDALLARATPLPPAPLKGDLAWRAAGATLLHFRHRRLGALNMLDAVPLAQVSPLGHSIAADVARAASVELESVFD